MNAPPINRDGITWRWWFKRVAELDGKQIILTDNGPDWKDRFMSQWEICEGPPTKSWNGELTWIVREWFHDEAQAIAAFEEAERKLIAGESYE